MRIFAVVIFLSHLNLFARVVLNENFEDSNWATNSSWVVSSVSRSLTYSFDGEYSGQLGAVDDYLITPELTGLSHLSLQYQPTNSSVALKVETSSDGVEFAAVENSPFTGSEDQFNELSIDLPENSSYVRFSKSSTGNIYVDAIVLEDDMSYTESVAMSVKKLKYGTSDNPVYTAKLVNVSDESHSLTRVKLLADGTYRLQDIANNAFELYESDDATLSKDDTYISTAKSVSPKQEVIFSDFDIGISPQSIKYLIATVSLSEDPGDIKGDYTIILKPGTWGTFQFSQPDSFYEELLDGTQFALWSQTNISEDFSDGDFTSVPVWNGDTAAFTVITPPETGDGSVNYASQCLASLSSGGDKTLHTESTAVYGTWQFFVADGMGWPLSSQNKFSVVLIADTDNAEFIRTGSENFNGYFIEYDGTFKLYRQDGSVKTEIFDTNYPVDSDNTNKNSGYSLKVERQRNGEWCIYIDEGDVADPMTLKGAVTDNTWSDCDALAVRTSINNPSDARIVYFDNLTVEESAEDVTVTAAIDVEFYQENIGDDTYITWSVAGDEPISSYEVWHLQGGDWVMWQSMTAGEASYTFDVTGVEADDWQLKINIEGKTAPVEISCADKNLISCTVFLQKGWNLLGMSNRPEFVDELKSRGFNRFWVWQDGCYRLTDSPEQNEAFWLSSNREMTFTFKTLRKENVVPELIPGWNMTSFPAARPQIQEADGFYLYGFDSTTYRQCPADEVEPLSGYWIFKRPVVE